MMQKSPTSNSSNHPEMLGAFPGFRQVDDDDMMMMMNNDTTTEDEGDVYTTIHDNFDNDTAGAVLFAPAPETATNAATHGGSVGEEAPLDDDASDKNNTKRFLVRCLCSLVLFGCVILVCVLIAWWSLLKNNNDSNQDNSRDSVMNKTNIQTWAPSSHEVPSGAATLTPTTIKSNTLAPSLDQNMVSMADQIESLLNLTVSLQDATQYKAVAWLATTDQVLPQVLREQDSNNGQQQPSTADFRYSRRLAQRYVLALLYFGTAGDASWKDECSFLNATLHECDWKCEESSVTYSADDQALLNQESITQQGVYCYNFDGFQDEIEHLVLVDNGLAGTLPDEMSEMIALRTLWLSRNHLVGTIPQALAANDFLEQVRLEDNQLHGPAMPWSQMSAHSYLQDWRVAHNDLTGTLATVDWDKATQLQFLDLSWNFVQGALANVGLFDLPQLHSVMLSGNELHGPLPSFLGTSLEIVRVDHNFLSGKLPSGLTSAQGLIVLDLRDNNFDGPVPESWFTSLDDLGKYIPIHSRTISVPRVGQTHSSIFVTRSRDSRCSGK